MEQTSYGHGHWPHLPPTFPFLVGGSGDEERRYLIHERIENVCSQQKPSLIQTSTLRSLMCMVCILSKVNLELLRPNK